MFWLDPNSKKKFGFGYVVGRVVDPDLDPDWIRIQRLVWIRIRIGNPDPDPGARKLRNFSGKNALFSYFQTKFYH
jgi:hypothetical protein